MYSKQVTMESTRRIGSLYTAFIPDKFAKVGKKLEIDEFPNEIWIVKEVYPLQRLTNVVSKESQNHKNWLFKLGR